MKPAMDYEQEMDRMEALEDMLSRLHCELQACKKEKLDLRTELERLNDHKSRLISLINQYREVLQLARCSKERNELQVKDYNCLLDQNEKMKRDIIVLRYDFKKLCITNDENEKKICEQEDEIEDLKNCCRSLLRKEHEMQMQLEELTANAECNDLENRPDEASSRKKALQDAKANEDKIKNVEELKRLKDEKNKVKVDEYVTMSLMGKTQEATKSSIPPQAQANTKSATTLVEDLRKEQKGSPDSETPLKTNELAAAKGGVLPTQNEAQAAAAKGGVLPQQNEAQAAAAKGGILPPQTQSQAAAAKGGVLPQQNETQAAAAKGGVLPTQNEAQAAAAKGGVLPQQNETQAAAAKGGALPTQNETQAAAAKGGALPTKNETQAAAAKGGVLPPQSQNQAAAAKAGVLPPQSQSQAAAAKGGVLPTQNETQGAAAKGGVLPPQSQSQAAAAKRAVLPQQNETEKSAAKGQKLTPSKVAMLTPSKVEMLSPSQAKMLTPSKAKIWSAAKAKKLTPSKAAMLTPSKVALLTPSQAKMLTPSKAKIWSAAKAKKLTPSKVAMLTPSKVEMLSPSQAAMLTPSKAKIWAAAKAKKLSPSKAAMFTPSKLALMTPSQAAMLSPSMAAFVAASKAKKLTPSKAAMLTPSEVEMLSPSQAAMLTPSKAKIWAAAKAKKLSPSKAAMFTPSKLALMTPSQAAMLSPSMAAFVAAAKAKQSTPSTMALAKTSRPNDKGSKPSSAPDKLYPTDSDESFIDMTDADSDFSNFLCNLNPANHKENIREIEKRYQQKLGEINNKNEEKVRKLIQQHEKEERVREKMYNDNVSNMRTGYNSDIHKLLEKHKASILRLQNLHEEEVQELNTNYETQLEAMQTQNENIVNDLTMGATAKFKILADQHNRDMKELEKKYQELLEKKEKQHVTDLTNLNSGTAPTVDGKNKTRNERCMNASGEDGNVTDIKSKHDRELKNLKRSNLKRIDMIRHKYEDLLTCERRKYEKQLEDMVQRLSKGKAITQGICQCRIPGPFSSKDPNAPLEFNDVLQKILTGGLENLTFNEVALVHRKTCAATEDIVLNPEMRPELDPPIGEDIYKGNELKANKKDLLNRILLLENDIATKQKETYDWIVNMELTVSEEKRKLEKAVAQAGFFSFPRKPDTDPETGGIIVPQEITGGNVVRFGTTPPIPQVVTALTPILKKKSGPYEQDFSTGEPASALVNPCPSDSDESFIDMTDVDSDFSNFLSSLNPANHKQNICDIEERYKQKLGEINIKNEEKVRKLIRQHEKEEMVRERMYDNNVSNIRTGYNTDFHKLVEKHKASILRLQNLHEEEVEELKRKYKTKLEAVETENESIVNDLTVETTARYKFLTDQHNRDMKELEKKYQELLEKKEKQHVTDLMNFNSGTAPTADGKNTTRNRRGMNASGEDGNVTDIKSKHERELKNLKRSNLKRIDMIRHKYEDLLTCEKRKYEKQLEDVVEEFRKGKTITQRICQCRMPGPCLSKDPKAPLEFNNVIQKILKGGLENLTFNELALVHRKTCAATEDIVLNPEMRPELDPPIREDIYKGNKFKTNKKDLLNRILLMENDIAAKQKETQDWINSMEKAVNKERLRLQKLRVLLNRESEGNDGSYQSKAISERNGTSAVDVHDTGNEKNEVLVNGKMEEQPDFKSAITSSDRAFLRR